MPRRLPARERPLPGESLTSLVRRHAVAMGYESIHRLREVFSRNNKQDTIPYHLEMLGPGPGMRKIAEILGQTTETVLDLTVHWYAPQLMLVPHSHDPETICDSKTVLRYFRLASPQVCVRCLDEQPACTRLEWLLQPISLCERHKCWLLNRCPKCQRTLRQDRLEFCRCRCGYDLQSARTVDASPEIVALQSATRSWLQGKQPPLAGMSPAACFWWWERLTNSVLRTPAWVDKLRQELDIPASTEAENVAQLAATQMICGWPARFEAFLDAFQTVAKHRHTQTGVSRSFGSLLREAARLEAEGFSTPADTLRSNLLARYTRGHLSGKVCLFREPTHRSLVTNRQWITQTAAARQLQLNPAAVANLVSRDLLVGQILPAGKRTVGLISLESVKKLQHKLQDAISVEQAAQRLGIGRHRVLELIHINLLPGCIRTQGGWRVPQDSIAQSENVYRKIPFADHQHSAWISVSRATRQFGPAGLTFISLLKLVLANRVRTVRTTGHMNWSGLLVHPDDLRCVLPEVQRQRNESAGYPLSRLARILVPGQPLKETVLRKWIAAGILRGTRSSRCWQILPEEVARFRATYCLAKEACQLLGISRSTLGRWEQSGKIRPIYSRQQNPGAGASVFQRADVLQLCRPGKAA